MTFVLLAAFLIRLDPACQHSLHKWDESFHALVAKNAIDDPLKPTLYRHAVLPYDYRNWGASHVWLHKPPGAIWLMAASMRIFGVHEIAMRLPSVLLATAAVLLTFLIGRLVFDSRVALLAAAFHAVNGFLVALASGRRVADHVDTALIFFVEVGVLMGFAYRHTGRPAALVLAGVSTGAALLTKSLPGLLVAAVAFFIFLEPRTNSNAPADELPLSQRVAGAFSRSALILVLGLLVAAPWAVYSLLRFPLEARWSGLYTLMHASQSLEGQHTHWLSYIRDMPRFFGDLVWIPVLAAIVTAARSGAPQNLRPIVMWVAIPFLTFSAMSTRLPGYVMIAAPALFLIQAWFWVLVRDRLPALSDRRIRAGAVVLLVLLALLPARYLLEPSSVFERRDRHPPGVRELENLSARLRLDGAVIFNIPTPIEAMFYSPFIAYEHYPTDDDVARVHAAGLRVVIYERAGTTVDVPPAWNAIVLRQSD
jgi:4-amino-4-deoxy-L-arabinose transferase-like glycosyltransferase